MSARVSLLAGLLVVLLAGCAARSAPPAHHRTTLQWGVIASGDVSTLDPALVSDPTSISLASLIYGGLVRLDANLRVIPDGASRWTISPDGRTYTFTLRPHLRFADGRPVRAADVAAALARALGPAGSSGPAPFYLAAIAPHGIRVLGARTLQIILRRPSGHFLPELAFPASFVPEPSLLTRYGPTWTDHAAGFGPYRVQAWHHQQSLVLVPNRWYWGAAAPFHRIVIRLLSQRAALTAYANHQLDLVSGLPAGSTPRTTAPGLRRIPALALDYLAFNTTRLPFHRLNARRAFAAAVQNDPAAGSLPLHTFLPAPLRPAVPGWQRDASAAAYLRVARYPGGKGFPPIALAVTQAPDLVAEAERLARTWQQTLHVAVTVSPLDLSTYNSVLSDHGFSLALVRWGADYPDAQDFLGGQLGPNQENVTGWDPHHYRHLLAQADALPPAAPARLAALAQAAGIAAAKLPVLPLDQPAVSALIRPGLRGVALTGLDTIALTATRR